MLLPVLVHRDSAAEEPAGGHDHAHGGADTPATAAAWAEPSALAGDVLAAVTATALHTLAMVAVAGLIAVVVYEVVGLRILRTAWINLDRIWAFALLGAGAATVLLG